jgi:toxin ParE1/3/4
MGEAYLSRAADADVAGIATYIAADNPRAALKFVDAVFQHLQLLATQPELGRVRRFPGGKFPGLRSWRVRGFRNYVMFYRLAGRDVEVVRVLHGARDLDALFSEPESAHE